MPSFPLAVVAIASHYVGLTPFLFRFISTALRMAPAPDTKQKTIISGNKNSDQNQLNPIALHARGKHAKLCHKVPKDMKLSTGLVPHVTQISRKLHTTSEQVA